jgi:hypothetical protein
MAPVAPMAAESLEKGGSLADRSGHASCTSRPINGTLEIIAGMAVRSFLTPRIVSPILIVVAFFLGRFTASRPVPIDRQFVPVEHPDSTPVAKASIPPGQSVLGFLDMVDGKPIVLAATNSQVQVSGWAACVEADSPLDKVEVLVDDKVKAVGSVAFPRPDVANYYGRADLEKSGWKASFSAHGIEAGVHTLKARVTCAKGESGILPDFSLDIKD